MDIPKLIEVVLGANGLGKAVRVDGQEITTPLGRDVVISFHDGGRVKTLTVDLVAEDIRIVTDTERAALEAELEQWSAFAASAVSEKPVMIGSALDLDPNLEHAARLAKFNEDRRLFEDPKWRDGPVHVITGSRAEGKTTLAMRWLLEAPEGTERCLIVPTAGEADHLRHEHGMRPIDSRIQSLAQFQRQGPRPGVEYGIDETVTILTSLLKLLAPPHLLTVCTAAPWQR